MSPATVAERRGANLDEGLATQRESAARRWPRCASLTQDRRAGRRRSTTWCVPKSCRADPRRTQGANRQRSVRARRWCGGTTATSVFTQQDILRAGRGAGDRIVMVSAWAGADEY